MSKLPTVSSTEAAVRELDRLEKARPVLAESLRVLRRLLPLLNGEMAPSADVRIDVAAAADRLRSGIPVLRGERVEMDPSKVIDRWLQVVEAVAALMPPSMATFSRIANDPLVPTRLLRLLLAGDVPGYDALLDQCGLVRGAADLALRLTFVGSLARLRSRFDQVVLESGWKKGACPMCGVRALLSEVRGLEQLRFLRCGLCSSSWEIPRLFCPDCGGTDHRRLGFLAVEGEESKSRASTCDECHGYLKAVTTLFELDLAGLFIADLATSHLDWAAQEKGFEAGGRPDSWKPGPRSGGHWGTSRPRPRNSGFD